MQTSTAMMLLILSILRDFLERTQFFNKAQSYSCEEIIQTLHLLLKTTENPTLRIQVLYTATFLHNNKSLQEFFRNNVCLTSADVNALLSPAECHFTIAKTIRLIEHTVFSTHNCRILVNGSTLEFLKKALENETDPDCEHRIAFLIKKLTEQSQQCCESTNSLGMC